MRILFTLVVSLLITSCSAQKKNTGILSGKVEIGPLCPQEPCNPSPERLKQIYDSYEVVLMDSASGKIRFKIPIQQDATFSMKIVVGKYSGRIKPKSGTGFVAESKQIIIAKGKTTEIQLNYDTGLR